MNQNIPHGAPPPTYTHLQPAKNPSDNHSFPPPSPTLSELKIQTFGHPLPDIPICSAPPAPPGTPTENVEAVTLPASTGTRGHKRKAAQSQTKTASKTPNSAAPPPIFELLVEVPQPNKKMKTGGWSKIVKVDPWKFGPNNVAIDITWDAVLGVVAALLSTSVPSLVLSLFTWKFLIPKNSPNLSLSSVDGHKSFLGQIQARIQKSGSAYVVLTMQKPLANHSAAPPWALSSVNGAHDPSRLDHVDEFSDSDLGTQIKHAHFDKKVGSLLEQIKEKYLPSLCSVHHDLACFHYKVNNLHFDLGLCVQCLVWAAAICNNKALLTKIPLRINFFKAEHALKPSKQPSEPSSELAPPLNT